MAAPRSRIVEEPASGGLHLAQKAKHPGLAYSAHSYGQVAYCQANPGT